MRGNRGGYREHNRDAQGRRGGRHHQPRPQHESQQHHREQARPSSWPGPPDRRPRSPPAKRARGPPPPHDNRQHYQPHKPPPHSWPSFPPAQGAPPQHWHAHNRGGPTRRPSSPPRHHTPPSHHHQRPASSQRPLHPRPPSASAQHTTPAHASSSPSQIPRPTKLLQRQVASYEVSESLASAQHVDHCAAMREATGHAGHAVPSRTPMQLLQGALGRPEAVMNGQAVLYNRDNACIQCIRMLGDDAGSEDVVTLRSRHGTFDMPRSVMQYCGAQF